jgi:hypothetical protein
MNPLQSPQAVANALWSFATAGQNLLTGPFQPSTLLSVTVSAYTSLHGPDMELVIFDSPNAPYKIFPYANHILFVEDTELTANPLALQAASTLTIQPVANGSSMTLIGVVMLDAAHTLT